MQWVSTFWINLSSSLWFIPAAFILMAGGAAFGLVWLDSNVGWELEKRWPLLFGAGAEGSRTLLAAIATSMIALAGVSFSITIVALSLAANQYTPRVLRSFMADRGNQIVLGTFVGIFVYCLLVLRTIHGGETSFIPHVSVIVAIGFALLGIGVFIYFIDHVAASIQVSSILAGVMKETLQAVETLFPERVGTEEEDLRETEHEHALLHDREWQPISAAGSGYIQSILSESLPRLAAEAGLIVRLEKGVGEFVSEGAVMAWVTPPQKHGEAVADEINKLFVLNSYRTIEQDPGFGVRQIVDIALKALSPGINDPATAVSCLDHLEPVLRKLTQRHIPSPFRYQEGQLRVIVRGPSFDWMVGQMLDEIRLSTANNVSVICRTLTLLADAARSPMLPSRRQTLWSHARLVLEQADEQVRSPHDRSSINRHFRRVGERLLPAGGAAASLLELKPDRFWGPQTAGSKSRE